MLARFSRTKSLRCSFCGKPAARVSQLMGGPKSYICNECVGVCNKILEATPCTFTGWGDMSETQLLDALKVSEASVEATRSVLQAQIDELRARRVSWQKIGEALGVSRQAAWERFS
ncbi:MAG: hypothetical protein MPJ78_19160 [Hyphomicrobiaceae bacterium]|nr:hypothetical protein [Hyphomicrobiaceae bacterium]